MNFVERSGLSLPLVQAPMAGVSGPALAAAVSRAGVLGSISVGATDADGARQMIETVRQATDRPFNVNVFVHATPRRDAVREAAWLEWLGPTFKTFGVPPPLSLRPSYTSFADDPQMLAALVELKPPVVSFHFGLPSASVITALKATGAVLLATATSLDEARAIEKAGVDVIVAQGIEAGGHRGVFDPDALDDALGTMALTRLLVRHSNLPVIAAGGIMDGAGIAAAMKLGAVAAQLGTAFILCPESSADQAYRQALSGPGAWHTRMTSIVSGRAARSLPTRFTELEGSAGRCLPPAYPVAYDAGKALHAAAKSKDEHGFGAQWAGQGAPLSRAMPAAELIATLRREYDAA